MADAPLSSNLRTMLDLKLVRALKATVEGWGQPAHPRKLGFHCQGLGLTCGDVYDFVAALEALSAERPADETISPNTVSK